MEINEQDPNKVQNLTNGCTSGMCSGQPLPQPITLSGQRTVSVDYSDDNPDIDTHDAFLNANEEQIAVDLIKQMLQGNRESFVMVTGSSDDTLQVKITIS